MSPRLSKKVKEERQLDKIAEFLAATAHLDPNAQEVTVEDLKEKRALEQAKIAAALEAEATLLYFNLKGRGFTKQICPECNEEFAYKYSILGTKVSRKGPEQVIVREYAGTFKCSDTCRRKALERIGIKWDPGKLPEERWGMHEQMMGPIPLIVPPPALEMLESKIQGNSEKNMPPVA